MTTTPLTIHSSDDGCPPGSYDHEIAHTLHTTPAPRPRPRPSIDMQLTPREVQILAGMANGEHNSQIGKRLFITEDTVKTHARRIFHKMSAHDRAHAVATGIRLEFIWYVDGRWQ